MSLSDLEASGIDSAEAAKAIYEAALEAVEAGETERFSEETVQQLMTAAHICVDEGTITSHIKRIRRKFKEIDPEADPIQTEYGIGYRWRT